MLTCPTSGCHTTSELNVKNYKENLAARLESICLVLYTLKRILSFIEQLTEHQIYLHLIILINLQSNKEFEVDHLPAAVYESSQYDDGKLKESWRLIVRVRK